MKKQVDKQFKAKLLDFSAASGKTMHALAELLLSEKVLIFFYDVNFDKDSFMLLGFEVKPLQNK